MSRASSFVAILLRPQMLIRPAVYFCLLCCSGLMIAAAPGADALNGRRVVEVRFQAKGGGEISAPSAERVTVKVNEPYAAAAVRQTIENIYATGRYHQVEVDAVDRDGGVALTFVLELNFFVGKVRVDPVEAPPTDRQLVNAAKLVLGEMLTPEKLEQARAGILRLLESSGYHKATVTAKTEPHPETQQSDIHFEVSAGTRARLAEVKIEGELGFPEIELAAKAGLKPGKVLTSGRLQDALLNLRKFYQKKERLAARVELVERSYLADKNAERVVIRANAGPRVIVRVRGDRMFSRTMKTLVPIYEEGAVDTELIKEGTRNLRNYFQGKGFYEVEVQDKRTDDPTTGDINIEYVVEKGKRHTLDRPEIIGNKFFDDETLRERLLISPSNRLGGGRFSRALLEQDSLVIRELYRTNGFQNVKVSSEVADDYQGAAGRIHVILTIDEGPQTLVGRLILKGNQGIPSEELQSVMAQLEGQAYSEYNALVDRDNVLAYYFDRGYRDATFVWKVTPSTAEPGKVDVEYSINEGRQQFVRQVLIGGEEFTRRSVIEREVRLEPDGPLGQGELRDTQRNLYNLGILSRVDLAVQNPEGDESRRTVLLQVEEANRWTVTTGIGAEVARIGGGDFSLQNPEGAATFSPRVSLDVTRLNFRGLDHTVFLKSRFSTIQQRVLLGYTAPRPFQLTSWTLYLNALQDHTRDVRTFTAQRLEGSVALSYRRSKSDTVIYRANFRRISISDLKIDPSLIPQFSQAVRIAMPSATLIRDRRDNPADSRRGIFFSADFGTSASVLGSEANFNRLALQYTTYHPFGKNIVLARSTQLGIQEPFGGLRKVIPLGATTPVFTREIPLAERFFSGGGNSHRGFAVNQAGPRDPVTGFPLGGAGLFVNSVELRFPVRKPDLGAVLFHDAGNVYRRIGNLSFRLKQRVTAQDMANQRITDFDYMVHAVGLGIRYNTPIGPVRLDFSYSLNPPKFYGLSGTINDLIRNPGNTTRDLHRLSRFQFFFSIGQTY